MDIAMPFLEAAAHCDHLADDIMKLADKVNNLEAAVAGAWEGNAGDSLANSLVDKASLVSYSAGVIRDAVVELRRGAQQLTQAQKKATEEAWKRRWGAP